MISPIENERSELPSPKTLKLEEPSNDEPDQFPNYDSDDWETLSDDFRLLDEEWGKSGIYFKGFDVDFSKLRHTFGSRRLCEPHETNRDLLNRLSNMAISYYNENTGIKLELVKVLRANFHPSAAITLYITFEANDMLTRQNVTRQWFSTCPLISKYALAGLNHHVLEFREELIKPIIT